jgi:hypothetical protein
MENKFTIQYLQQAEIDQAKWDECIDRAGNGLVYAYSMYLDHMADNWDALVLNDYEMVMPLPWRRKFGIHYLYQPFLVAQLGLFGNGITPGILEKFLQAIPRKFRLWEFPLNHGNLFSVSGFDLYERSNFILPLKKSHEEISSSYRENLRRNLRKSVQYGSFASEVRINEVTEIVKEFNCVEQTKELDRFTSLYLQLEEKNMAACHGIYSKNNELLASAAFLFSHRRAYYLLVGNHPNGRTLGASHALLDHFIRMNAGKDLVLDFEGSDIRNLAFFYSSFGAQEEKYTAIKRNHLPWYMRWLKK